MLRCGVKLTHDGGVAIFEEHRLLACYEREKWGEAPRHSEVDSMSFVEDVLEAEGVEAGTIGEFVIDGWYEGGQPLRRRDRFGQELLLRVNTYGSERDLYPETRIFKTDGLPQGKTEYASTSHVIGHIAASYSTSPFANRGEQAYVVVWDGGTTPRLYHVRPGQKRARFVGAGKIAGNLYNVLPLYSEPFRVDDDQIARREINLHDLSVPGKVMALCAYGSEESEYAQVLKDVLYEQQGPMDWAGSFQLSEEVIRRLREPASVVDALAALDHIVGSEYIQDVVTLISNDDPATNGVNLCVAGGAGLNVRWNSKLRAADIVSEVWVPPFPNDSGMAIGAVIARLWDHHGASPIDWRFDLGPHLGRGPKSLGWSNRLASPEDLGHLIHQTKTPIVVLDGRAELGPRALGKRSIFAPATSDARELLNCMKGREWYRPVAPICLEDQAARVFDPGIPDPYMLFNHVVRDSWRDIVPGVVHVDGTARLQTVSAEEGGTVWQILNSYYEASGVPVLCNTSANRPGRGFFSSVESALDWGRTRFVWAEGTLYERSWS
jgi:carbamoyltransferase